MDNFASLPLKLVKLTSNGNLKICVFVNEKPFNVVLKPDKANELADKILSLVNSKK